MKKILICVDMQKDFVDGALGTKEAQAIVTNVVKELQGDYDLIVATRDTHGEDYLNTNEGKHLPVVHCVKDTDGWQLVKEVKAALKDRDNVMIIDKPVFGSEKLPGILKEYCKADELASITLIGLCTDICVISNAILLKTAFPETPIYVKEDCCAGVTPASHQAAIDTMKMCQIDMI